MSTDVLTRMSKAAFERIFADGRCTRDDLVAAGFTAAELEAHYQSAIALAVHLARNTERTLPRRARRELPAGAEVAP